MRPLIFKNWMKKVFFKDSPRQLLFWSLAFLIGAIVGSYVWLAGKQTISPDIHFLVMLQGVSTTTTLLFIWSTINQMRHDREVTRDEAGRLREFQIQENKKERNKERLREQLLFYTPIVGLMRQRKYIKDNLFDELDVLLEDINHKYELYAEPNTKRILRKYYIEDPSGREIDAESSFLKQFRVIVLEEFGTLRDEYLSLMGEDYRA